MKKIAVALLFLALTACGSTAPEHDEGEDQNEKNKELIMEQIEQLSEPGDEDIHLQVVKLPGRQGVYCIIYNSSVVTCDWDHKIALENN